jgi:hypothetical protein
MSDQRLDPVDPTLFAGQSVMPNSALDEAVHWIVAARPERPIVPKLRYRFGLPAELAIRAIRRAGLEP